MSQKLPSERALVLSGLNWFMWQCSKNILNFNDLVVSLPQDIFTISKPNVMNPLNKSESLSQCRCSVLLAYRYSDSIFTHSLSYCCFTQEIIYIPEF